MLLDPKPDEKEVDFWRRQNQQDNAIGIYCQSCCYRYPDECDSIGTLHPYDRAAEICADFVPKDYYKSKDKAKCWLKRLEIDPDWEPLPTCDLFHPYYRFLVCDSKQYYKIMTKEKVMRNMRRKNDY